MQLFFKHRAGVHTDGAWTEVLSPANSVSEGLEFALLRPRPGVPVEAASAGRETVLVILGGRCAVEVQGMETWTGLGARDDVFSGPAASVYVPPGVPYRVTAEGPAEVAAFRAPAPAGGEAYVIRPADVRIEARGRETWRRSVHTILDESRPARRLVVGETFNEPGGWSSYPPHKHDRSDPPREVRLQEVYYFRLAPPGGFGVQRLYSPERGLDLSFIVEDGDTVLIPFGYHPVAAAPGYRLYYLWALAGEGRRLVMQEDPAHAWVTKDG